MWWAEKFESTDGEVLVDNNLLSYSYLEAGVIESKLILPQFPSRPTLTFSSTPSGRSVSLRDILDRVGAYLTLSLAVSSDTSSSSTSPASRPTVSLEVRLRRHLAHFRHATPDLRLAQKAQNNTPQILYFLSDSPDYTNLAEIGRASCRERVS